MSRYNNRYVLFQARQTANVIPISSTNRQVRPSATSEIGRLISKCSPNEHLSRTRRTSSIKRLESSLFFARKRTIGDSIKKPFFRHFQAHRMLLHVQATLRRVFGLATIPLNRRNQSNIEISLFENHYRN